MRHYLMPLLLSFALLTAAQNKEGKRNGANENKVAKEQKKLYKVLFGIASYYADKFNGRETYSGENYDSDKPTAACNVLPMGTWIRVTNMRNEKSVIVKVNDRLHPRMKRLVDLSRSSAEKLGYTQRGLTQVRVEVLGKQQP